MPMSRRFQFSLGRLVLSDIVLCVALALFGCGLLAEDGVLPPFLYVGASGIAVAMSIGLLAKQIRWLVIGAVIGEVAYGCLFWMWGMFDEPVGVSISMPPAIVESEPLDAQPPPPQPMPPTEIQDNVTIEL
jgi:hypothetical protein